MESTKTKVKKNLFNKKLRDEIQYVLGMYMKIFNQDPSELINSIVNYSNGENLPDDEKLFVYNLLKFLNSKGIQISDILQNKDIFMFRSLKAEEGSFFTPLRWVDEVYRRLEERIDFSEYYFWDCACGSGNLLYDLGIGKTVKGVFASTLNPEDIPIVKGRIPNVNAFQLDFLAGFDTFISNGLTDMLPEELRNIILNNEKLCIIINPPYSTRGVKTTVGQHLMETNQVGIATDLYRQFIWQVCNLVQQHNLTNIQFALMVSGSLHLAPNSQSTMELLFDTFDYQGGFLYPASDFEAITGEFEWAITTTLWSASDKPKERPRSYKLDIMRTVPDTEQVQIEGSTGFALEVQPLIDTYLKSETLYENEKINVPRINSYGEHLIDEKLVGYIKGADFAMSYRAFLRDAPRRVCFRTLPVDASDLYVSKDRYLNVFYALAYSFDTKLWEEKSYQRWLFPVENEFYKEGYLPNAVIFSLFCRRNLTFRLKDFHYNGEVLNIPNRTFPLSKDECLNLIKDTDLMEDLLENHYDNSYIVELLEWAVSKADPVMVEFYEVVIGLYRKYLSEREVLEGVSLSKAYDLNFGQIRRLKNFKEEDEQAYSEAYRKAVQTMKKYNNMLTFDYEGELNVVD